MIEIRNLDTVEITNKGYGGHSGSKLVVLIDNKNYLLKYPNFLKKINNYTTSPLSEYIGSHIYEIIGIDTHKTILGIKDNKLVVACLDFLKSTEEIIDFNAIKNNYNENIETFFINRHLSQFEKNDSIESIIYLMNNNYYFKKVPELKIRFWDMFIVDAFINNNDRNEANWGLIYDKELNTLKLAPVYDNGASFYGKSDDTKLESILNDEFKFKQMAYDSAISVYTLNDKIINPLKFIESMNFKDCNDALIRLFPKIDMNKIKELFLNIEEKYDNIIIFSKVQKEVYYKVLEYRYNILKKIYKLLK